MPTATPSRSVGPLPPTRTTAGRRAAAAVAGFDTVPASEKPLLGMFTCSSFAREMIESNAPAAVDADYSLMTQRGEGRCVITTASGDRLFARWSCAGEPDKGCAGRFVLLGGTGPYQGVTGDGDFTLRIQISDLTRFERLEAEYDLAGLATWPELRYRTP